MGTGTMTPVTGDPGAAFTGVAQPLPRTHLSLTRYARILGINPVHFQNAFGDTVWPVSRGCDDIWVRENWQNADQVGHRDLAYAIKSAEDDLERFVGYPLAPSFIAGEVYQYPKFYRRELIPASGINISGSRKSVTTRWRKLSQGGRRGLTAIETGATVVYTDDDGDGLSETATITVTTTVTDDTEIKVYVPGQGGAPEWELRWPKGVTISSGTATIVFDSWDLVNPDLQAVFPDDDDSKVALNIEGTTANFLATVDVYREYVDDVTASAQFFWEPDASNALLPLDGNCSTCSGSGCPACTYTSQDGCAIVRDSESGIIVPVPATYDTVDARWEQTTFTVCRDPDQIKLWYYAGDASNEYLNGFTRDPLSDFWARTIAMLATARLERNICGCGNTVALAEHWRQDIAFTGNDTSFLVDFGQLSNPFGTKRGELEAFKRTSAFRVRAIDAGLI